MAGFRSVNLAMQSDPEFRALHRDAQHLYYTLWCHAGLSFCGVLDWRPGRIAAGAAGWTADEVRAAADSLEAQHFIVTDSETEECLIRSWFRFDGLLKQPHLAVSLTLAFHVVSSNDIRGVLVHELRKHREREPKLAGWGKDQIKEILGFPAIDPKARAVPTDPYLTPRFTPTLTPSVTPSSALAGGGVQAPGDPPSTPSPSPTPSPNTKDTAPRKRSAGRGTRISIDFEVDDDMRSWALTKAPDVDLDAATEEFVDYWIGVAGTKGLKQDWIATWRNRMRECQTGGRYVGKQSTQANDPVWGKAL